MGIGHPMSQKPPSIPGFGIAADSHSQGLLRPLQRGLLHAQGGREALPGEWSLLGLDPLQDAEGSQRPRGARGQSMEQEAAGPGQELQPGELHHCRGGSAEPTGKPGGTGHPEGCWEGPCTPSPGANPWVRPQWLRGFGGLPTAGEGEMGGGVGTASTPRSRGTPNKPPTAPTAPPREPRARQAPTGGQNRGMGAPAAPSPPPGAHPRPSGPFPAERARAVCK